jgi:hypothetical protein
MMIIVFKSHQNIANSCRGRLKKEGDKTLTHTAIIVNNVSPQFKQNGLASLEKLADIINWLMLTQTGIDTEKTN